VKFGGKIENNFILVYVEDSGIGIQPQMGRVIFKAFRQGEETITRSYGGTGLGLSISRGIIELLDGMIWIDYSFNSGALFCFSIPVSEKAFNNGILKSPKDFELLKRKNLLIIDNNITETAFIPDIFRAQKANISWIKYDNLTPATDGNIPDLIIFDSDKNSLEPQQIIHQFEKTHPQIPLILIIPKQVQSQEMPIERPDIFVMAKPVNIQLMLVKCIEILSRK
jgi:hypothetical protein